MSDDIIFVLPNESSAYYIRKYLDNNNMNIPVYEAFMDHGVLLSEKKLREGVKVIISRGSTATLLKKSFAVPVVEIRYSFYEFAVAMQKALTLGSRVALVGYNDAFYHPELADFFEIEDLQCRVIQNPDDTMETLEDLKQSGTQVIISGPRIGSMGRRAGMESVLIRVSDQNIREALAEAKYLRDFESEKQRQFDSIAALLEEAQEGILSIDTEGTILSSNHIARQMLKLPPGDKVSVRDYLPETLVNHTLNDMLVYNEVISQGKERILVSGVCSRRDGVPSGAVLTLQSASDVHRKEYELRRNSLARGRVAKYTFESIIGESPAIEETRQQARLFAKADSNVLINGPTGTGKELFAQSIHNASRRARAPFVAINCAALPESILESELFGYVKGAFTGAKNEGKRGIFEQAHTGTIFLDEISEIPPAMQARLLRVIQEREVTRIGDEKVIPVDVRIIASTNRDLAREVRENRFREDLFYRLNVLSLQIPPLRERGGDVLLLMKYYLDYFAKNENRPPMRTENDTFEPLRGLLWPGNIRQLRNVAECAVALFPGPVLTRENMETVIRLSGLRQAVPEMIPGTEPGMEPGMVPDAVPGMEPGAASGRMPGMARGETGGETGLPESEEDTLSGRTASSYKTAAADKKARDMAEALPGLPRHPGRKKKNVEGERTRILRALEDCGGNKTRAAEQLGMGYATLWRRLKALGML